MNEHIFSGTPKRDPQNEALMLLGANLANKNNLPQKDLSALIAEHYIKPPAAAQVGQAAAKEVKLLPAKTPAHH